MKKIRTIGAVALLLGMSVPLGCGADGSDQLGEPINTETEAVRVSSPSIDPINCVQSASQCRYCTPENPNDCVTMHCCPFGQAMTGLNIGENTFQCRGVIGAAEQSCRLVRNGLRYVAPYQIRACPEGFYMKGYHAGINALTCCEYPMDNRSTSIILDGQTQVLAPRIKDPPWPFAGVCGDGYVHACPANYVMEGYSIGLNYNVCGR